MTKSTSGGYDQLEPSPGEIEQELTEYLSPFESDLGEVHCK